MPLCDLIKSNTQRLLQAEQSPGLAEFFKWRCMGGFWDFYAELTRAILFGLGFPSWSEQGGLEG